MGTAPPHPNSWPSSDLSRDQRTGPSEHPPPPQFLAFLSPLQGSKDGALGAAPSRVSSQGQEGNSSKDIPAPHEAAQPQNTAAFQGTIVPQRPQPHVRTWALDPSPRGSRHSAS